MNMRNAATKFTENVTILYNSFDKEVTANTSQDYYNCLKLNKAGLLQLPETDQGRDNGHEAEKYPKGI